MLYIWGIFFNGINWLISISRTGVAFGNVGFIQIFSMVFYAVYGLSISIILKRFGAITRTFINTAAICSVRAFRFKKIVLCWFRLHMFAEALHRLHGVRRRDFLRV